MVTMRFLYRRHLALRLLNELSPHTALEIGFSTRPLLSETTIPHRLGIDLNPEFCRRAPFPAQNTDEKDFIPQQPFDLVIALEVLEHLPNDDEALQRWASWLNPGGHLLLSVPARMAHWDANDVFSGHVRRYEKKELQLRLAQAGFHLVDFYCYGFPLFNLLKRVGNLAMRQKLKTFAGVGTSQENPGTLQGAKMTFGKLLANPLVFRAHDLFLGTDLGIGYMALVKKEISFSKK